MNLRKKWMASFRPSPRTPAQTLRHYQRLLFWIRLKRGIYEQWDAFIFWCSLRREMLVYLLAFTFITVMYLASSHSMARDAYKRGQYDGMAKTLQTLSPHMCVPSSTAHEPEDTGT